jgi:hypothetical protein
MFPNFFGWVVLYSIYLIIILTTQEDVTTLLVLLASTVSQILMANDA